MKYTLEEIEGIENLCRFLCNHQDELHNIIMKSGSLICTGGVEEARDLLIMKTPIIQGTSNQSDLVSIGNQKIDESKVRCGVDALLTEVNNANNKRYNNKRT